MGAMRPFSFAADGFSHPCFFVKFQFSGQLHRTTKYVILSGVRSTESKNLRISSTFAVKPAQRSFDSA